MSDASDAHTAQPSLRGKKVVITGGTTGIGRATAVLLASAGARVFVCGRTPEHLDDALRRIREVGEGDGINVDLAEKEGVRRFFDAADAYLGGLDISVINAGIAAESLADTNEPDWRYAINTDLVAYVATAQAAAERMAKGGDIVFIGSMSAKSRKPGASVYVAAKAGVQGFAEALGKELAERDIKVGLIEPGKVGADMQREEYSPEEQARMIAAGKMMRAEDIAVAVHYMLTQPRRARVSLMRVEPRLQSG